MKQILYFFSAFQIIIIGPILFSCSSPLKNANWDVHAEKRKALLIVKNYPEGHIAHAEHAMVVTQGISSSRAGLLMFKKGGNIADAAAAVSFAISVERPQSTGLGGGGFLLFKKKDLKIPLAFDFREMAPLNATRNMYLDDIGLVIPEKSLNGAFSIGVPGLVAGIVQFQRKYGKLPLSVVMAPAIELAEKGFKVYHELGNALLERENILSKFSGSKKIFFKGDSVLKEGDMLFQPDLAHSLKLIAKKGEKVFYQGEIGEAIVAESKRNGGILKMDDLRQYQVKERIPVRGIFKGHTIYSMSPPSSGGTHIIQLLNMLENDDLKKWGVHHPESMHLVASSMRLAFRDRAKYMGDDDFVEVPVVGLTSKKYAKMLRGEINISKASSGEADKDFDVFKYETDHTTHFTIMDGEGNAIVSTQTINGHFGSGVVASGTGIVLNNEMDDFAAKVGASNLFGALGGEKNLILPRKRPLSSMSPTVILKDGVPVLALGTPSGTKILTCVFQTILNVLEFDLTLPEAVAALRYHHQYSPNKIFYEPGPWDSSILSAIKNMGHQVEEKDLGCLIQAASFSAGDILGVSDPRGEGLAVGL